MNNDVILTIIIPVYNAQKHLKECLDSVIDTNIGEYEIILVDDGSTDESPQICDEYKNRYNFVEVIHKKNGGPATARNAGIDVAKGEYITFVDSDDYLDEKYIKFIKDNIYTSDDIFAFSYYVDYTRQPYKELYGLTDAKSISSAKAVCNLEASNTFNITCDKVYKKSMLNSPSVIRFKPHSEPGEDLIFNIECLLKAKTVTIFNRPFYHWVRREEDTLANRFRPDLIERNKSFINYRIELYEKLGIINERFDLLAKGNIDYIFACIPNMYRKGKMFSRKERIGFYRDILSSDNVKKWIKSFHPTHKLHKHFLTLYKLNSPLFIDTFYHTAMSLRNTFGKLWIVLRKKF